MYSSCLAWIFTYLIVKIILSGKKKKAHHILTEKKKVITFSRTGEKIVQDTYMVSEVYFYINSSPSTTKVFGDYTYYLPINHQSFGNWRFSPILFCNLQLIARMLCLHTLAGAESIRFFLSPGQPFPVEWVNIWMSGLPLVSAIQL